MYAWTVSPLLSLTRATLRLAELGFFGFAMKMLLTTPLFCGLLCSSGDVGIFLRFLCFRRVDWLSVTNAGGEAWNARRRWGAKRVTGVGADRRSIEASGLVDDGSADEEEAHGRWTRANARSAENIVGRRAGGKTKTEGVGRRLSSRYRLP